MSWKEELQREFEWDETTEPSIDLVIEQAQEHGFESASDLVSKMNDAPSNSCPTGGQKWKWYRELAITFGYD